jgi:hypothetical protein
MRSAAAFLLLLWPLALFASEMEVVPVGDFGGFRLRVACALDGKPASCLLDTAGGATILAADDQMMRYPSLGQVSLRGVGTIFFTCDRVKPSSFSIPGLGGSPSSFLRCPGFPPQNSPMVGMDYLRGGAVDFLFHRRELRQASAEISGSAPFLMVGADRRFIGFPLQIGGATAKAIFDTGNPVTMVRPEFVASHPELFRPSARPRSEMMVRNHFYAYEPSQAFVVQGAELKAEYVYAADLSPITGEEDFDVVLGMNHLVSADWTFDFKNLRFQVNN